MADHDPVEIKVNIGGDVDDALRVLDLDKGSPRDVLFLDDVTQGARPSLPLLHAGVILRLRRRKPKDDRPGKDESTVKLRPCRRSQLVEPWHRSRDDEVDYHIEGDWSRSRRVLAASCSAELPQGSIDDTMGRVDRRLDRLFTEAERSFLSGCASLPIELRAVTALGPIKSRQWKDFSVGDVEKVNAERWTVDSLDFLELSIRVDAGPDKVLRRQLALEQAVLELGLRLDSSEQSKTERVMTHLASRL